MHDLNKHILQMYRDSACLHNAQGMTPFFLLSVSLSPPVDVSVLYDIMEYLEEHREIVELKEPHDSECVCMCVCVHAQNNELHSCPPLFTLPSSPPPSFPVLPPPLFPPPSPCAPQYTSSRLQ